MQYKKNVKLKDGRECIIRTVEPEEAADLLECFVRTHAETDLLLTYAEECRLTVEDETKYIEKINASETDIEICAYVDGKMVGSAGIGQVGPWLKVKHRGEFGISVLKDYWGLGIGSFLTEAIIDFAREVGYSQINLDVIGTNEKAQNLYRKHGFVEYGRNPRGFLTKDGAYQELVYMYLDLA